MFDKFDESSIDVIYLEESGQKKLLDKIRDDVRKSIFVDETPEERQRIDSVVSNGLLRTWFSSSNGYDFKPHAYLHGIVAEIVGKPYNDIFLNNKLYAHVFIPWTDIYDIDLTIKDWYNQYFFYFNYSYSCNYN